MRKTEVQLGNESDLGESKHEPQRNRVAHRLRDVWKFSADEIADAFGVPTATVVQILAKPGEASFDRG